MTETKAIEMSLNLKTGLNGLILEGLNGEAVKAILRDILTEIAELEGVGFAYAVSGEDAFYLITDGDGWSAYVEYMNGTRGVYVLDPSSTDKTIKKYFS